MLCTWWNFKGIIHFELVPNNLAMEAELYSTQLERMYEPEIPSFNQQKQRALLQQDNTSPHTTKQMWKKIEKLTSSKFCHIQPKPRSYTIRYSNFRCRISCMGIASLISTSKLFVKNRRTCRERQVKTIENNGLYFDELSLQ